MADHRFCYLEPTDWRFPSVCYGHVLSYLSISDCVSLAATSTSALSEVLDNIAERREQLKHPVAIAKSKLDQYCHGDDAAITIKDDTTTPQCSPESHPARALKGCTEDEEESVTLLPSTQDRVGLLAEQLPGGCGMYQQVQQLRASLYEDIQSQRLPKHSTQAMIDALRRVVFPLKLCSIILREALVCRRRNEDNDDDGHQHCSRKLHHYMGHVLCLAFLFDNLEPSREMYACVVKELPSTYRFWVMTHASFIRRWAFSEEPRKVLRILDESLTIGSNKCFSSLNNACCNLTWLPESIFHEERHREAILTLVYDDFAPLGPQFRGRDIVQIRDVSARSLLAGNDSALDWIRLAHDQVFKTRPMTVRPPEIRF